ncbi:MAG TPA: hypothetical protein VFK73_00930, partial [Paludibacter sp.]|nr:hypothetical protein [Paludibacter sp.]
MSNEANSIPHKGLGVNSHSVGKGFFRITEQHSLHNDLDQKSVSQLLVEMNEEDQKVALVVQKA